MPRIISQYSNPFDGERTWLLFQLICGISALALLAVTWQLWIPQGSFPQIPLLEIGNRIPTLFEWLALGGLVTSFIVFCGITIRALLGESKEFAPKLTKVLLFAIPLFASSLILVDQHRLQPWMYQFVILSLVFGFSEYKNGLALCRIFAISIYIYSAAGKLDFEFLHSVGNDFLKTAFAFLGIEAESWPTQLQIAVTCLFPFVELLLGAMLVFKKSHYVGAFLGIALHVSLLLILGPFGLNHAPGVLVWNLFFILQIIVLFSPFSKYFFKVEDSDADDKLQSTSTARLGNKVANCLIVFVVLAPSLERFDLVDHWPSWAVYAPHSSRAIVEIHQSGISKLPNDLRQLCEANSDDWLKLRIDLWSIKSLKAPIYPQNRFQLGVAEYIADQYKLDRDIRVHLLGTASRFNGDRSQVTLYGRTKIKLAANQFRLNSHPRIRK